MKILAVIPFRRHSARIPEKIYKTIGGAELCATVTQRVVSALKDYPEIEVLAAVDDQLTREILGKYLPAQNILLTDPGLPSGTDRVYAAALLYANEKGEKFSSFAAIINIQGDMPFLSGSALQTFVDEIKRWDNDEEQMLTPFESWPADMDHRDLGSVKIVCDEDDRALYFSRYPIPCSRNFDASALKMHVGIYAFTPSALETFCRLPASQLEKLEGLEQLRALGAGIPIRCAHVVCERGESFRGIDTPADLEWAEKFAREYARQNLNDGS